MDALDWWITVDFDNILRRLLKGIPRQLWVILPFSVAALPFLFSAAWWVIMPRSKGLQGRDMVAPLWSETQGLPPGRLERALPRGALAVVGIREIHPAWKEIQETNFGKALKTHAAKNKGRFPSIPEWVKLLGPSALAAAYGESDVAGPRALLVLAEAAPDSRQADLTRFLGKDAAGWYTGLVNDVWVITQNRVLATQAGELLKKPPPNPPPWLSQALLTVPSQATMYFAFDFDALKPASVGEAAAWDNEQPVVWSAGGAYFRNYLWADFWAQRRERGESTAIFREPPHRPAFPFPREAHPVLFLSYHGDLGRLGRQAFESWEKNSAFPPAMKKLRHSPGGETSARLVRHLGDEAGLFLGETEGANLLPPAAVFARLKHSWLAQWRIGSVLKKMGWHREGALWTYAPAGDALPVRLSLGFHKGFAVLGSPAGVDALTRKPSGLGTNPFASILAALSAPDKINSLVCLDAGGVGKTLFATHAAWRPKAKTSVLRGKTMDVLETLPPVVGYTVNTREGVYSRWLLNAQDRSQSRWSRMLERVTPGSVYTGAPPAVKQEPRFLIEEAGNETRITIHGGKFPFDLEPPAPVPVRPVVRANLMKDPDWMVRRDTARAMAEVGTSADLPALRRLLKDPVSSVRDAARTAIDCIESDR